MSRTKPFKTGYLHPDTIEVSDSTKGKVISIVFKHTEDPSITAGASMAFEDSTYEWPRQVFLRVNADYPEAIKHIAIMTKFAQVAYRG